MAKRKGKISVFIRNFFQDTSTLFWRVLTVVISLFTLFVIASSLWSIICSRIDIARLEKIKMQYQQSISADSLLLEKLKYDEHLETFARERFGMQRKEEKVFIIK